MASPPSRLAPPPPVTGFEDTIAQLKAAMEKDPAGFANDDAARVLLEQLNSQIEKLYEEGDEDEDDEDDEGDEYEYRDAEEGRPRDTEVGDGLSTSRRSTREPRGPRPYDLWRAAHESDDAPKTTQKLSSTQWGSLVDRLNESSRRKQAYLMRAQHAQIAAELSGLTFTPHISEKSRELAAHNKSLPQRIEALIRKKRTKLEKIRHEKVTKEMAEATFKPDLEKSKASVKHAGLSSATTREKRQIGHLMQYDLDKRIRAEQRRQFVQEMQDRELTFNPVINKNSSRIVDRLNREREDRGRTTESAYAGEGSAPGSPAGGPSRTARRALAAALAAGVPLATAAAVTGVPINTDAKALKALGRSYLPGHEEETFHPRINPRSATLHRPGMDDKDVYSRLYQHSTTSRNHKVREASRSPGIHPPGGPFNDASSVGSKEREYARDAGGYPVDEAGEPAPGHPHYFNVIAFEPGRMDFILRRLVAPSTGGGLYT